MQHHPQQKTSISQKLDAGRLCRQDLLPLTQVLKLECPSEGRIDF